jgi:hypothetical protein
VPPPAPTPAPTSSAAVITSIPNVVVPTGAPISFPFGGPLGLELVVVKGKHGKKFLDLIITNYSSELVSGELVLFGLAPRLYNTGLSYFGNAAQGIFLLAFGSQTITLPLVPFFPVVFAGLV